MERITKISVFLACVLAVLCSCNGTDDLVSTLDLSADKTSALVGDIVTFTVKNAGVQDVSGASAIKCEQTGKYLSGNVFEAESAGEWTFVAEYDGMKSNDVTVTVQNPVVSKFRKHVCLMEFTGQWCAMCPEGASTINFYATQIYPEVLHVLAFHNDDDFSLPQEAEFSRKYPFGGYPGYVTDMKYFGLVSSGTQFKTDLEKAFATTTLHCGVSLSSSLADGKATVNANVWSELPSSYRIAAYVVEDKIVAKQNVSGTYNDNYTHRHVVRKMLSASIDGDDLGRIEADAQKSKEYSIALDPSWNTANLEVCVLVIGEDGCVNNTACCHLDGGKADFDIK
ncbi:MAG: Omp28-related outer membrane protein [Candidatus Cryptobacteroides sp.]